MAAPLVELALDYYRDPLAYRHLAEVERPLPQGFGALLAEFCTALSSARITQTAAQVSADPGEMEEAARFFVRHVLLGPAGDFYRHLGLNRDAAQESIRHHYQLLIRMFHPDRVDASTEVGAFYATRLNLAYQTLRDPETRAVYDRGLPDLPAGLTETDPAGFFRPSLPVLAGKPPGRFPRGRAARGRHPDVGLVLVGAVVLGVLVFGAGYVLFQANQKPGLRLAASGSGETSAPLPSYLAPSVRIPGSDGRAAGDPLPPIKPAPVHGALSGQDRTGIRAVEDAPVRVAAVPARVSVSPVEPPTPSATASSVTPEKIDADRLNLDRLEVVRSESGRVVRAVPHEDLAKAREPEALVIPPVSVASASAAAGRDIPPPKAIPPAPPPAKPVLRRSEEPQADLPVPKRAAPAPPARPAADVAERAPGVGASRPAATPEKDAAKLIARLESAYATMNADGFAALFTANARVNEGSGRGLIRSKYADLFRRTAGAKLSIGNVRWRSMPDGRISGSGAISVGNRYRDAGGWRYAKGGVDLELVLDGGGYRIASMIYRLN